MSVSLNSFFNHANSIGDNRSIYLSGDNEVKDKGAFRSFFTSKDTFRAATNEFLNALQNEFGQEIGGVARGLLQKNVDAGKPLKACEVKECVQMARQMAMRQTLTGMAGDKATMESFIKDLTGWDSITLNDEQFGQIGQFLTDNQVALENIFTSKTDNARQDLIDSMQKGNGALLKRTIDLVAGNQNSPLVRIGYPNENDPQMVKDKLQVLNMFQTLDGPIVSNPVLIQAMTALDTVRQAHPAPAEFTGADLFNAVFPENTTPTMERPSNEEIALYTPSQLLKLFDQATEDFTNNFTADMLPDGSPLKGSPSHTNNALGEAKAKLFMPSTVANLTGDRVTLQDLPQMQFDVTVNSRYETMEKAVTGMAKDISRRGMMGMTAEGQPPTISFQAAGGTPETVTIGSRKYDGIPDDQLTAGQKEYKAGNESDVSRELQARVVSLASSPAQAKAMVGCLTQNGSYPMWHAMKGFGDFAYFREHCAYNQTVTQNADGSVDISLTTSPDLKSLVGTATMNYHVDTDGRTGITDFQWDKPSLQDRKDGMKNCAGYSQSIPSRINSAIKSLGLIDTAAKLFATKAHAILDARVDAATTPDELPSFESIRDAMPPSNDAEPALANFAKIAQHQTALRFYMSQTPENRDTFAAATIICKAVKDDLALAMIQDFLPQLKELHEAGNLNADTIWQTMFHEDMPEAARKRLDSDAFGATPLSGRIMDKFSEPPNDTPMSTASYAAFFSGVKYDTAMKMKKGELEVKHLDMNVMRIGAGMVENDLSHVEGMENVDGAEEALAKDLVRQNVTFSDMTGKLKHMSEPSMLSVNLPSGKEGAPQNLQFDPLNPKNLSEADLQEYRTGKPSSVSADIRERITNFCGKENRAQITNALLAMSQCGRQFLRDMPILLNVIGSEHAQANITVFGDDQKNIHVRYENVENSVLKFNYEYSFDPDGGQTTVALDLHRADVE